MAPSKRLLAALLLAGGAARGASFGNPWEALPPLQDEHSLCVSGPIEDTHCDSEAVESANSLQLHSILEELTNTTFFRMWRVNLHEPCMFPSLAAQEHGHTCGSGGAGAAVALGGDEESAPGECHVSTTDAPLPFEPTHLVDTTVSRAEDEAVAATTTSVACDDEELPEFWVDMCSRIPTEAGEVVNLKLNPESDTAYNGSHVWAAMYQENCFVRASNEDAMCLEERVLYRLLSGMHASTNIHIALNHASHGESLHGSPARLFAKHLAGPKSQRVRDLHFAFVVLLRALHKGAHFARAFPFGADDDGLRAKLLVDRLLDSCILQSCSDVFTAFDEGKLFQRPQVHTWWSLKRQFKGVFHNISSIVDCVQCQKCRLHGKLQLLGLGTALKWLLLPPDLIASTTGREEFVALINTLAKFSRGITGARQLSAEARREGVMPVAAASSEPAADEAALPVALPQARLPTSSPASDSLVPAAIALVAAARQSAAVSKEQEACLLRLAFTSDPALVGLAASYGEGAVEHLGALAEAKGC